jgi:hypothetical protein
MRLLGMPAAVKLDDKTGIEAEKIGDVWAEPDLAAELGIGEAAAA